MKGVVPIVASLAAFVASGGIGSGPRVG